MVNSAEEAQPVAAGVELGAKENPLWLLDFSAKL